MTSTPKRLAEYTPEELGTLLREVERDARIAWGQPRIPTIKAARTLEEIAAFGGDASKALPSQLAFMKFPEFQVYANLPEIDRQASDFAKTCRFIAKHEIGYYLCPYDATTLLLLQHAIAEALPKKEGLAHPIMNLYTDTIINTQLARTGHDEINYFYREVSTPQKAESALWRVYMRSCERLWNSKLLSDETKIAGKEEKAAEQIAAMLKERVLINKRTWQETISEYARLIAPFMEQDKKDGKGGESSESGGNGGVDTTASENTPDLGKMTPEERERALGELAREISKPGTDGLPTNKSAVKEYRGLLAGIGIGDPVQASISFYERLASKYNVKFATKPFGRPRTSPFSVIPWTPSEPVSNLDVQHTLMTSGAVLPGVTTKQWRSRTTTVRGGEQEVIPTLDLYLDSSGSMPNPVEETSLPVLAGFVAARRAIARGVRSINYSGKAFTQARTADLHLIYKNLVVYQNGDTTFPIKEFLDTPADDPRLSLIITDTFLANEQEAVNAIRTFRGRNAQNRVTIYAITSISNAEHLRQAGAEVIHGTTPNIFKHVLGKTEKAYLR